MFKANHGVMEGLAALLSEHGSQAVLEALRDAADACGDHSQLVAFHRASVALSEVIVQVQRAEFAQTQASQNLCTLAMGAEVLADCPMDEEEMVGA